MLYLYKPHVTGPGGDVTTPDIIVEYLVVNGAKRPLAMLTTEAWQQAPDETAQGAYAVTALGGGALLLPAVVLGSGLVVASRSAWRLNNMDGHIGRVTLNGLPLFDVGLPETIIAAAGGTGDTLPREMLLVQTAVGVSLEVVLDDPVKGRGLRHKVVVEDLSRDRWGDVRPRPRYSVGPTQKEVAHYI